MTEPTVCAILLTRDRPEMTARAVRSFRAQAYAKKRLLVLDTGSESTGYLGDYDGVTHHWADLSLQGWTIGQLRNEANKRAGDADILCHWDSDDLSHPNRIAEQVALLQASGADAVGYSDLLFWKMSASVDPSIPGNHRFGSAWLYTRPSKTCVPGTSLCYWRKTWERKPFPHLPERGNPQSIGEDVVWQAGLKVEAVSSILSFPKDENVIASSREPRMIASVHGDNTMAFGYSHIGSLEEYRRVPMWDRYCQHAMELK
jgi:glycosyltransferase involved in cell wall biosynthesis